jgi:serine/threonine protein phosphatase PrpC
MQPIRDIDALDPGTVVYHPAFGFARVLSRDDHRVHLSWEAPGDHLPQRVGLDVLQRVYAACAPGGFFHRAMHEPANLTEWLQSHPADALALLLVELPGPQRRDDLEDWIVGRRLFNLRAFGHWWRALEPVLAEDGRFTCTGDMWSLRDAPSLGIDDRLQSPMLPAGRRLELALAHRAELGDERFTAEVLRAWRTGETHVRDLALSALAEAPPERILVGLLDDGPESVEALIHAVRRGGWAPEAVSEALHQQLIDRVLSGLDEGGPLDAEGRLAAALTRWPSPVAVEALAAAAHTAAGHRLLRATFAALPPRRGEALAFDLLEQALGASDRVGAQWLGGEALAFSLVSPSDLAERLSPDRPLLAQWFRQDYLPADTKPEMAEYDDRTDEGTATAEIDLSELVRVPIPLSQLPARSGAALLGMGLAIARALSLLHKDGVTANPSSDTVRLLPDESVEITPGRASDSPRPMLEAPSPAADVYAAGVLLVEALLGRAWPRHQPASRAIPYLRFAVPSIAPSALAPLDAALHGNVMLRPPDGLAWLAQWQAAAVAEEARGYAVRNPLARLTVGYDSHIGRMKMLQTQTNQDALFVSQRGALSLMVLCDGISTANAGSGDVASSISCHVIANLWEQAIPRLVGAGPGDLRAFLDRALRMANTAVCEAALRFAGGDLTDRIPMGTTILLSLVHGNHVSIAWLGDSRIYLVGPYGASLVTADENQAAERLKAWHLRFLESWDPGGFALVGYVGHFDEAMKPEALSAHHLTFTLVPGERLVLCTDGITDYIAEAHPEVSRVISEVTRDQRPEDAAHLLTWRANQGGGGDNCSCIVAALQAD